MVDWLKGLIGTEFLNEPAWRWALFFIACSFFSVAWSGVLHFMK